jgi:hypothetical protein
MGAIPGVLVASSRSSLLPFLALLHTVILIEMVLLDIVNDGDGDEVADTHLTPEEESDLGATDIILDELLDNVDIVLPGLQTGQSLIDVCATALDNKGLISC